jgi:hypothetical protein
MNVEHAPRRRYALSLIAFLLSSSAMPCMAQDIEAAFAARDDADMVASLGVAFSSLLSLTRVPDEAHGLGGSLRGAMSYVDDDKMALFEVASIDYHTIFRAERDRYESGSMPTVALFSLSSQLRLTNQLHLLYGAALSRSGPLTHASTGGLAFHLGTAFPLLSRSDETMRHYRRAYLQVEMLPLVGSLLTNLLEEGFHDEEHPVVQVQGEVALTGRVETFLGSISAEARLSASYVHQRSMLIRTMLQWTGPTFWRRVAITMRAQMMVPLRPFRRQVSENAQLILYEPHSTLSVGLLIYLDQVPSVAPEHAARRRQLRERHQTRRQERQARRTQQEQEVPVRRTRPTLQ